MIAELDIVRIARTIGDPTRIRILNLLMEGRALTAKELSYGAGVGPATGTAHLQRLLDDRLVISSTQGRHKYFRLASPMVAKSLESLMVLAKPAGLVSTPALEPIRVARFCYDHLAGRVAVQMVHRLLADKILTTDGQNFTVTAKGERWLRHMKVDIEAARTSRRKFSPVCLDWSERQDHIAGALGAALAERLHQDGWFIRKPETRVVEFTPFGRRALKKDFGIDLSAPPKPIHAQQSSTRAARA